MNKQIIQTNDLTYKTWIDEGMDEQTNLTGNKLNEQSNKNLFKRINQQANKRINM